MQKKETEKVVFKNFKMIVLKIYRLETFKNECFGFKTIYDFFPFLF